MAAALIFSGCTTASQALLKTKAPAGFRISKVGVSPKSFWPQKNENAAIRWSQNYAGETTLEIRTENGELIRKYQEIYLAGEHTILWDGKNQNGEVVAGGIYLYVLSAADAKGREFLFDPSADTGGEELTVEKFTFDKETGELKFILPRAGYARLRVGLSPFMHLKTLLDWEPMEAGAHTIVWDGLDESGTIKAIHHPNLSMNLAAFSLPDNAVIVQGPRKEVTPPSFARTSEPKREGLYFHVLHDRGQCRDITFEIEFPDSQRNQEGLPILKDEMLVRVRLKESDENFMVNQRFEVMYFVDTVFLYEEEEGQNPFNYIWDTKGLNPGEHLLTVNLIGYEDHLGVKTIRVIKK